MRDIDRVIDFIRGCEALPPVIKQVLVNRVEPAPTREELDRARAEVYPEQADA